MTEGSYKSRFLSIELEFVLIYYCFVYSIYTKHKIKTFIIKLLQFSKPLSCSFKTIIH